MLELIAIALLQLASFTNNPEQTDTRANTNNPPVIVITPAESEQGGGGWGGD